MYATDIFTDVRVFSDSGLCSKCLGKILRIAAIDHVRSTGLRMSLDRDWAPCTMTRVVSTCLETLRHFALIIVSRGSILLEITPSRMMLWSKPIGQWRASYSCYISKKKLVLFLLIPFLPPK